MESAAALNTSMLIAYSGLSGPRHPSSANASCKRPHELSARLLTCSSRGKWPGNDWMAMRCCRKAKVACDLRFCASVSVEYSKTERKSLISASTVSSTFSSERAAKSMLEKNDPLQSSRSGWTRAGVKKVVLCRSHSSKHEPAAEALSGE